MSVKAFTLLFIAAYFQFSWAQSGSEHSGKLVAPYTSAAVSKSGSRMEIPATTAEEPVVEHTAYSLVYSEEHEQAKWVAYELTEAKTVNTFERTDKFMTDPLIVSGSATDSDYEKSGYDRGHLAPAADMGWSEITIAESFYYSNMSPQVPSFNRGIWKKAEELVRNWAIENKHIYIVTGPVLTPGLKTIGANQVSVPDYYYKVILDYSEPGIKGIGFVIPNEASKQDLKTFAISIDSVEKVTGIDFFPLLTESEEHAIEKAVCIECWTWDNARKKTSVPAENTSSVQCSAKTNAGNRCKRMTKHTNGLCTQHGGN